MLAENPSNVLSFSWFMASACSYLEQEVCVFPVLFSKRETEHKTFCYTACFILFRVRVTRPVPAVDLCHFCATLSFQKIKEISKEEQSYVNATDFCSAPKKDTEKSQTSQGW